MCGLVAALIAGVLGLPSANAFVGEAIGVDLNQATCTNTTTGATAAGDIFPGGLYDCETISTQRGDIVEVTLSGIASTGNPDCVDVMENPTNPPLLPLVEGACYNLIGSITTGFGDLNNPTPSFEVDGFAFQAAVAAAVRLSLVGDEGVQFVALLGDLATQNILLTCILTPESCRGDIIVNLSAVLISGSAPGSYTLELRVVAVEDGGMPVRRSKMPSDHVTDAMEEAVRRYVDR